MAWRNALRATMRGWGTGRIGIREADRMVARDGSDTEHAGLGAVLAAAAAPPTAAELAGERTAVSGFARAYAEGMPPVPPAVGAPTGRPARTRRTLALRVAAALAVFLTGGAAFAAGTGQLPDGLQRHAHRVFSSLGVPAPDPSSPPAPHPRSRPAPVTPDVERPSSPTTPRTPSAAAGSALPGSTPMPQLCREWDAARADPRGRAVPAELREALAAAAGGEARIGEFCAGLLTERPDGSGQPRGDDQPGDVDPSGDADQPPGDDQQRRAAAPEVESTPRPSPSAPIRPGTRTGPKKTRRQPADQPQR